MNGPEQRDGARPTLARVRSEQLFREKIERERGGEMDVDAREMPAPRARDPRARNRR